MVEGAGVVESSSRSMVAMEEEESWAITKGKRSCSFLPLQPPSLPPL